MHVNIKVNVMDFSKIHLVINASVAYIILNEFYITVQL